MFNGKILIGSPQQKQYYAYIWYVSASSVNHACKYKPSLHCASSLA